MVITSMSTYDSTVQWPGFTNKISRRGFTYKTSRMELIKLQRSDCLVTTGMSTAPNIAMQVLLFM